jgi:putative nucleotidyltransferase with HDIG domain
LTRARIETLLGRRLLRDRLLRQIRDAARSAEAEVWLVGGYVRDAALGRAAPDVDLIAGRGAARLVRELRARFATSGFRFRKRGVTTWRFRVAGRDVDLVDASRRGLERDLRRRDFTVNAIAFDLVARRLADPLGGLADLRARRLRLAAPDALSEDPLRALRAARLLAQLPRFGLDRSTRERLPGAARGLGRVACERIGAELDKLLLADAPLRGLDALRTFGLLPRVLPELVPLAGCQAGDGRPDVWRHTLDALARSVRSTRLAGGTAARSGHGARILRWALLLHDISKPETLAVREDGRPTFHGHETLGARRADALLRRLRLPGATRRRIGRLILHHLRPSQLAEAGAPPRGMRRLAREAGEDLPLLTVHAACDALASGSPDAAARWRRLRAVLDDLVEQWERRRELGWPVLVDGRDVMRALGLAPGPRVGQILAEVRERQAEGALGSREEALAWLTGRAPGGARRRPRGGGR